MTWTYFFRRLTKNPAYYKLANITADSMNEYLRGLVNVSLGKLINSKCVEYNTDDETVSATTLGRLASFYYLSHETIKYLNLALGPQSTVSSLI